MFLPWMIPIAMDLDIYLIVLSVEYGGRKSWVCVIFTLNKSALMYMYLGCGLQVDFIG